MQFGRALFRVLQRIRFANPAFGPVYLSKIDISDGFYRVAVRDDDVAKLALVFPSRPGEPPLVALPLRLPMGWKNSVAPFCACTETVADLANASLASADKRRRLERSRHRLDVPAETPIPSGDDADTVPPVPVVTAPRRFHRDFSKRPLHHWDVYVDDFLGLVQGNPWRRQMVKRALLHFLDKNFRPVDPSDSSFRQEPASIKKLLKGDGTWSTRKIILGWFIDTVEGSLRLPPHRIACLHEILDSILLRSVLSQFAIGKRCSVNCDRCLLQFRALRDCFRFCKKRFVTWKKIGRAYV